jgi:hypothetical protein
MTLFHREKGTLPSCTTINAMPAVAGVVQIENELRVTTCPTISLTPLTNPVAKQQESQPLNVDKLEPQTRDAIDCLQKAVKSAGGTFVLTSAYRHPEYQSHLREVWRKHRLFANLRQPECKEAFKEVEREFKKHQLLESQEPGGPNSSHGKGLAFDATITLPAKGPSVDSLARNCGLTRPLPKNDPVHFQIKR